jgi:hypothetical protein
MDEVVVTNPLLGKYFFLFSAETANLLAQGLFPLAECLFSAVMSFFWLAVSVVSVVESKGTVATNDRTP